MSAESYQKSTEHLTANLPKLSRAQALKAVRGPAVALIAVSALTIAIASFSIVGTLGYQGLKMIAPDEDEMAYEVRDPNETKQQRAERKKQEERRASMNRFVTMSLVFISCMGVIFINSLVLSGAMKMRQLKGHKSAVTAAAIAIIPVLSPLCVLGIPFGVWAMIKLNDREIKRYFTN
jgi:hypothetical protein